MGWQESKIPHTCLIKHQKWGLSDIRDYYWAIQLDQLKHWITPLTPPVLADIECYLSPTSNLKLLLLSDTWRPWDLKLLNAPTQASLIAWTHLIQAPSTQKTQIQIQFPTQIFESLIPSISVKPLINLGIQETNAFYHENSLLFTEELIKKYNIPKHLHYTCVRILHFISKQPNPPNLPASCNLGLS